MAANNTDTGNPLFKGNWNNNKCIEIAFSDHFPCCVKDVNIQKNIITRYLNFYLGAKPQKGLTVTDLAFAVLSIMPLHEKTETFLWRDENYKLDGTMFFLTPEDKLKAEVGHIRVDDIKVKGKIPKGTNLIQKAPTDMDDDDMDIDEVDESDSTDEHGRSEDRATTDDSDDEDLVKYGRKVLEKLQRMKDEQNIQKNKEKLNKNTFKPTAATTSTATNFEYSNDSGAFALPTNIQWFSKARVVKQTETELNRLEYGPVENSAFTASCNKLLEKWDTDENARITLKYFFGIVALILMRGTTKKYPHLVNTFANRKFQNIVVSGFLRGNLSYCVPHKKCFKNSFRTFRKRDGKIPVMFAKIVVESFHIDTLIRQSIMPGKLNILKYTLLSHTADFGFGLVGMLQNIQAQSFNLDKIIAATHCNGTAKSWSRLKLFLETYMVKNSKEATHHWARVISTDFFRDLCCNANYELSVILGSFIEKITASADVWQSAWVKCDVNAINLENLKVIGMDMYKKYKLLS